MSNCNHDCGSCSQNCSDRTQPESFLIQPHKESSIKKIIGVVSGKGGVGKSLVTSMLATAMQRKGYQAAVLDADITGPSMTKVFGITSKAEGTNDAIYPAITDTGIEVISVNMLLETDETPVIWRGPVIAGMVKQFYTDVVWKDVDFMFVDMPPGTGDVPLTIFQSLPLDGIVIVTSPQELVSMVVTKAINMAKMMNVNVLGLIENMSYVQCDECDHKMYVFGESHIDEIAKEHDLEVLAQLPLDPTIAALCDAGNIESVDGRNLEKAIQKIEGLL
ncbi:Mrp/NBP35 family ATP-binding protein [Anaerorhabdus sp.]|uniref:Mrp/NBP35 family ATP-binding protein n=1 Tax=Anaerorhabdus sp. TaxID=1872524 RepID=UPI002B200BCB|nr:Mrp/NBP35 family ATP-binding protein [Anaerorhabdus sp.]MEA4873853.1 Mrp/NBP35 family ATP-binding protein [Anaerorhabdus sp.]